MLCEQCKKNVATTHIHTVINGVVTEKNLCGYCAANLSFGSNSIVNMIASMFGETLNLAPEISEVKCDCCGMTFSEIAEGGRAGCSKCYISFENQFLPLLQRIHGNTRHIGKVPDKEKDVKSGATELENLKAKLQEAISAENFEQAAILRDKIKLMEGKKDE